MRYTRSQSVGYAPRLGRDRQGQPLPASCIYARATVAVLFFFTFIYLFIYKYTGATCPVSTTWKREGSERRATIEIVSRLILFPPALSLSLSYCSTRYCCKI